MLGERTAEEIKMAIGSAFPSPDEPHAEIRGRDLVSGLPKTIVVSAPRRSARRSRSRSTRSSTRSRPRSTSARRSSPATSWTAASSSPAAARCSRASTSGCGTRPACRSTSPTDPLDSVALGSGKCVEEFEALQQVLDLRAAALVGRPPARCRPTGSTGRGTQPRRSDEEGTDGARERDTREPAARWCCCRHLVRLITIDYRGGDELPAGRAAVGRAAVFGPVEKGRRGHRQPVSDAVDASATSATAATDAARLASAERRSSSRKLRTERPGPQPGAELDELLKLAGAGPLQVVPRPGHRDRGRADLLLDGHDRRRHPRRHRTAT